MIMKIKLMILILIFYTGCSTMVKRTIEPSLDTENQKLKARVQECETTVNQLAGDLEKCFREYKELLNFVVLCSQMGEKMIANSKTQTLTCGEPE